MPTPEFYLLRHADVPLEKISKAEAIELIRAYSSWSSAAIENSIAAAEAGRRPEMAWLDRDPDMPSVVILPKGTTMADWPEYFGSQHYHGL